MQRLMIPLQKLLNKRNRSIKSLKKQIEKTTETIQERNKRTHPIQRKNIKNIQIQKH